MPRRKGVAVSERWSNYGKLQTAVGKRCFLGRHLSSNMVPHSGLNTDVKSLPRKGPTGQETGLGLRHVHRQHRLHAAAAKLFPTQRLYPEMKFQKTQHRDAKQSPRTSLPENGLVHNQSCAFIQPSAQNMCGYTSGNAVILREPYTQRTQCRDRRSNLS